MSDLLPPNASAGERALSLATERHAAVGVPLRSLWDAETCPANLLAWLAWAFTVDEWDSGWSTAKKRAVIGASIQVHRFKGTIGAVRDALAAMSYGPQVQEWFNQAPEGDPYTFRVLLEVGQIGITQADLISLSTTIENTKNLRSHTERIDLSLTAAAGPVLAAAGAVGSDIVLTNYVPPQLVINPYNMVI